MITQNKTKLQFLFVAILFLMVSVSSCNNGEKAAEEPAKTETPAATPPDSTQVNDSTKMEATPGSVSPTPGG
ncbi:MAG: hypothetical protein IPL84_14030 [Chitinophagaceae bacterium]|nr:hypothetical protein [Chitinophagaceae bacterium]